MVAANQHEVNRLNEPLNVTRQFASVLLLTVACLCPALLEAAKPNIVVILADDMGYGDVRALNPTSKIPTPHVDQLAADGMTFTDAHTPSAVCTPTRYGLLTGRYCWRTRLTKGVLNGYGVPLIDQPRETIADFLGRQGYHTGIVGKWHLGLGFATRGPDLDFSKPVSDGPHTHGFAFSHVIPASLDFPPYVYIRDGKITDFPKLEQPAVSFPRFLRKGERSPDLIMEEVLDELASQADGYIRRQANPDQPFFLYIPLTAPHKPVWPHRRFVGNTKLGPYGDFIAQVDAIVGDILKSIDDADVRDNTLVIYTSDNGSFMRRFSDPDFVDHVQDETVQAYRQSHHRANGPFRGTKADIYEAGHHVLFFARWPEKITSGSECAETICLTDIFRTTADIVGANPHADAAPDSFSLWPLMQGQTWDKPRAPVVHHSAAGMFAIRDGKWKMILGNGSGGRAKPRGQPFGRPYQLYDITIDIAETNNLIGQHPEVAKRLEQQLEKIRTFGASR
jgi:arylsulfatase A-like enzyme